MEKYTIMYGYVCQYTGQRHHVGCDRNLLEFCNRAHYWNTKCNCGMNVVVSKVGNLIRVKHETPPSNVVYIHSRKNELGSIYTYRREGNILKQVTPEEVIKDPKK